MVFIRLILLSIVSSIVFAAFAGVPSDEADPYVLLTDEADREIAAGNYTVAIARLEEAVAMRPDSPANALLLSNLGHLYGWLGNDSTALENLNKALDLAPGLLPALRQRADTHVHLGCDSCALADLDAVIARDSTLAADFYLRGMLRLRHADLPGAESDISRLSIFAPDDPSTDTALGLLYSMTSREREAIPHLRRAADSVGMLEIFVRLAQCQLYAGDLTGASETIAKGFEAFPDDPQLYYCRSLLNRQRYRPDEAEADLERARKGGVNTSQR